jgi:hypothetical protein
MHCQGIACTRSLYVAFTSAGGQKVDVLNELQIIFKV